MAAPNTANSVYFNKKELGSTDVAKDNKQFVREEIRKDSSGNTVELRRVFLDLDGAECYQNKLFYQGVPAAEVLEDESLRITIYPWSDLTA